MTDRTYATSEQIYCTASATIFHPKLKTTGTGTRTREETTMIVCDRIKESHEWCGTNIT